MNTHFCLNLKGFRVVDIFCFDKKKKKTFEALEPTVVLFIYIFSYKGCGRHSSSSFTFFFSLYRQREQFMIFSFTHVFSCTFS